MKKLVLIVCMVLVGSVFAQEVSDEDIVGVYKPKSNDPVGGRTMVFMPDHSFVMVYFGGLQKGTWELKDKKLLITRSTEPQFALYGRNLDHLGNKTQLNFQMDADNGVMVGLDSNKKTTLKPVFNQNANCFSHPYIFTQEKELIQLQAAQSWNEITDYNSENKPYTQVYRINIFGAYNDLILINLPSEYTERFSSQALYKDGMLYMSYDDEGTAKRPLESLNEEDFAMIKHYSNISLLPNQLQKGDEFFPYAKNPTQEELKSYTRIDVLEISMEAITIQEGSFFTTTCAED